MSTSTKLRLVNGSPEWGQTWHRPRPAGPRCEDPAIHEASPPETGPPPWDHLQQAKMSLCISHHSVAVVYSYGPETLLSRYPWPQGSIYWKITHLPWGEGKYQPMSFGWKNLKRVRDKGGKCKRKRKKEDRKRKKGERIKATMGVEKRRVARAEKI